jgi:hypothetical protein
MVLFIGQPRHREKEMRIGKDTVQYAQIRKTFMTGDLVFFHGLG